MIKQVDADYFGGAYQLAGGFDVLGAGCERSARVIVSDDKGVRIIDDRSFEYFARMDKTRRYAEFGITAFIPR